MANYATLKAAIAAAIKQNGNNEITGALLQQQLLAMVNSLGANFQFKGTAQLNTDPGTPDQNVFVIPIEPGTYVNFGGLVLDVGEVAIFYYNGTWGKSNTLNIFSKDVIAPNLKKFATVIDGFNVNENVVSFPGTGSISLRGIGNSIPKIVPLGGQTFTFSTSGLTPDYLVLHSDDTVELVAGAINILETDTVLLAYYGNDMKLYFGLLGDEANAKRIESEIESFTMRSLLPPNSALDNNTPLRQSGAGLWELRSANQGNSITKQNGYFHIEISRSENPAIWITALNLSPYDGDTVRVRFYIKTSYSLRFFVGNSSYEKVINADDEWQLFESNFGVGSSYGDWRIMLYCNSATAAAFDIKDIEIVTLSVDENKYQLYKQLNSKYFDGDGLLAGKKLSVLGDSISTFGVPDQNNATGTWTYPGNRCRYPQSNLFTEVNECYWKRLIDKYGMFLGINESWAGSRVSNTQPTDSGDFGPNRCISSQTRIGHLGNNGTPDIILVYAGTNDAGGGVTLGTFNTENPKDYTAEQIAALPVVTFADAYRAMLIRLLKTYPNARIIVILPNLTSTYYSITNLDAYIEVIKEECDFFGVKYIDTRTAGIAIYNQGTFLPDGIHPNGAGMELIYKLLCREIFDELSKTGL